MASIKALKLILFFVCLCFNFPACAQNIATLEHLGNSGKKFTPAAEMSSEDWNNPEELERVWQASLVRVPSAEKKFIQTTISEINSISFQAEKKYPTVIYLHGCSGVWSGTLMRINFLAENGFAVIAPPSFARMKYPKSCDLPLHQGGLYRDTIKIRQFDAGNTIAKAKQLSWVDSKNVFLMGLSEGGITTATFDTKDSQHVVKARVIEGWTCTSTWSEYRGLRAPKTEPVLALLGDKDPWFQNPYTNGECTHFMDKHNGSKSIVFKKGDLRYKHELLEDQHVQKIVLDFLRGQIE